MLVHARGGAENAWFDRGQGSLYGCVCVFVLLRELGVVLKGRQQDNHRFGVPYFQTHLCPYVFFEHHRLLVRLFKSVSVLV